MPAFPNMKKLRVREHELLPPVSVPFRFFLSYSPCRTSAQLRQTEQKALENCLLTGALQFSRSLFGPRRGAARREYFCIFKGWNEASAQFCPRKPTGVQVPSPYSVYFCRIVYSVSSSIISSIALANTGSNCVPMPFSISSRATCCGSTSR